MTQPVSEFDELRLGIERLRALLENLVVRGLRACGSDELLQLQSLAEYLENAGAGHVASILVDLRSQIEKGDRSAAGTLLGAQTAVRLLERLLTLRIVKEQYRQAIEMADLAAEVSAADEDDEQDEGDQEEEGK